jgi:hypothetical protein
MKPPSYQVNPNHEKVCFPLTLRYIILSHEDALRPIVATRGSSAALRPIVATRGSSAALRPIVATRGSSAALRPIVAIRGSYAALRPIALRMIHAYSESRISESIIERRA